MRDNFNIGIADKLPRQNAIYLFRKFFAKHLKNK